MRSEGIRVKQSTRATARSGDSLAPESEAPPAPAVRTVGGGGNLAIQRLVTGRPAANSGLGVLAGGGSGALGRLHMKLAVDQIEDRISELRMYLDGFQVDVPA